MAGPKPKEGGKRQTVGVALTPFAATQLDDLLKRFRMMQPLCPDWIRLPDTRSAVAAWILERNLRTETDRIEALLEEYGQNMYPPHCETGPDGMPLEISPEILKQIDGDPFWSVIRRELKDEAERTYKNFSP